MVRIVLQDITGEVHKLELDDNDYVSEIKDFIHDTMGIHPSEQLLTFSGKPVEGGQVKDHRLMNDGAQIHVHVVGSILVCAKLMSGREIMLQLKPHNTIMQLKEKFARKCAWLPLHLQSIYRCAAEHDGWYRMDATTLSEMGLFDGSTVHVCWD